MINKSIMNDRYYGRKPRIMRDKYRKRDRNEK